jgi:hypothetical protein
MIYVVSIYFYAQIKYLYFGRKIYICDQCLACIGLLSKFLLLVYHQS